MNPLTIHNWYALLHFPLIVTIIVAMVALAQFHVIVCEILV
jgi:hypothetical protein